MASRGGPRAAGTDGMDFSHREIIKEQYYARNPGSRHRKPGFLYNDDPGVRDEDEEISRLYGPQIKGQGVESPADLYSEQEKQELYQELQASQQKEAEKEAMDGDLPLAGDYHGMGGPHSVPLISRGAFNRPHTEPHPTCLLDELYLSPSPEQIRAFKQIFRKRENATNKSRLRWTVIFHLVLTFVMLVKLLPEIFDYLDIFVLELEELFIPKAKVWEWTWVASSLLTFFGLSACKKSVVKSMQKFVVGIFVLGLGPVVYALILHFNDVYTYAMTKSNKGLETWKGYPVAFCWYIFLILALQVHVCELAFGWKLINAWKPKKKN